MSDELSPAKVRLTDGLGDVEADAARWRYLRRHWANAQFRFYKVPNTIRSVTLTIHAEKKAAHSREIDREIDAAIQREQQGA